MAYFMIESTSVLNESLTTKLNARTLTNAKREATNKQTNDNSLIEIVDHSYKTVAVKFKGEWLNKKYLL